MCMGWRCEVGRWRRSAESGAGLSAKRRARRRRGCSSYHTLSLITTRLPPHHHLQSLIVHNCARLCGERASVPRSPEWRLARSLADAEPAENLAQDLLDVDGTRDAPQGEHGVAQFFGGEDNVVGVHF